MEEQVIVNVDFDNLNEKLTDINTSLSKNAKILVRDCAITLFTNTNFDDNVQHNRSVIQVAKDCLARAKVIVKELQDNGFID